MPTPGTLSGAEDAFGHQLLDELAGGAGEAWLERDDGSTGPSMAASNFLTPCDEWNPAERQVFDLVRGRVLDVGCGAGRHSIEAQSRGLDVVAIDISPGAVEASRRRGVRDVRLLPIAEMDERLGTFHSVLMMCGNVGLAGSAGATERWLRTMHGMTTPPARIVLDTVDPYQDADAADLVYIDRNRARGCDARAGDDPDPVRRARHALVRSAARLAVRAGRAGGSRRLARRRGRARRSARLLRRAGEALT